MNKHQIALAGTGQSGTATFGTKAVAQSSTSRSLNAVCVDIIHLGMVPTNWGPKPKLKLIFETEELKINGQRRCVCRTYNICYYMKASLRQDLESWLGRPVSSVEMCDDVDFQKFVGMACQLDIQEATAAAGHTYLKVVAVRQAVQKALTPSGGYRRRQEPGSAPGPCGSPRALPGANTGVSDELSGGDELNKLKQQVEAMLAARDRLVILPQIAPDLIQPATKAA